MEKLIIHGPCQLEGSVAISSAKNSTLLLLAAALLSDQPITFQDLPHLADLQTMLKLLKKLGATCEQRPEGTVIHAGHVTETKAHYDIVRTMRASILVLGPLLTRFGQASVSLPGGCAIGERPIDLHLSALEKMGAVIRLREGYVETSAPKGLKGAMINLTFPSVGATENTMMAAVFAQGTTVITNAAREPEIIDLARFLTQLFPALIIEGAGSSEVRIHGVERGSATPITYRAIGDRIEAATYMMAALITKSELNITGIEPAFLQSIIDPVERMGAKIDVLPQGIKVHALRQELKGISLETAPYPGFPTDVQAQFMALTLMAQGTSIITEHIFENRFMHVSELKRLGAQITLKGRTAVIQGQVPLSGATVMCTDLRASAALVLAALVAQGTTTIRRIYHLDRGYSQLDQKLKTLGAKIERLPEGDTL